jgi:hypothetical protein
VDKDKKATSGAEDGPRSQNAEDDTPSASKRPRLSPSTATIPRLVSVVEIIKREFDTLMAAKRNAAQLAGGVDDSTDADVPRLQQYNLVGCLEDEPNGDNGGTGEENPIDRAEMIRLALEGKNQYVINPVSHCSRF